MKKISDLPKDDKDKLTDILTNASQSIGIDYWEGPVGHGHTLDNLGLCSSCVYFKYTKSLYRIKLMSCEYTDIMLNESDPVLECTSYSQRGRMTLQQMESMAILIDVHRRKIGLI